MLVAGKREHITIESVLLAIYVATTPIHQTLSLGSIGTVTKYLAFATMILVTFMGYVRMRKFSLHSILFSNIASIAIWFCITLLWAINRSVTISSLGSIFSYFALILILGSKEYNQREKNLLKISLIIFSTYIAIGLLGSIGNVKRATYTSGYGNSADQNVLAANIAIAVVFAIDFAITSRKRIYKLVMLACASIILAGIVTTGSRGGLISLIASLGLYFYKYAGENQRKKNTVIFATIIMIVSIYLLIGTDLLGSEFILSRYSISEMDSSGRVEIAGEYLNMMVHQPISILIGVGTGNAQIAYSNFYGTSWPPATHNDVIRALCETGLIGLLLVIRFVWVVWKRCGTTNDVLGKAVMLLMLVACLDVNVFTTYGWWNAMIFAFIGVGNTRKAEGRYA